MNILIACNKLIIFLTHKSYRVKMKQYSGGDVRYFPQVKYRLWPFWLYFNSYYGGVYYNKQYLAWMRVRECIERDKREYLIKVENLYTED